MNLKAPLWRSVVRGTACGFCEMVIQVNALLIDEKDRMVVKCMSCAFASVTERTEGTQFQW